MIQRRDNKFIRVQFFTTGVILVRKILKVCFSAEKSKIKHCLTVFSSLLSVATGIQIGKPRSLLCSIKNLKLCQKEKKNHRIGLKEL